MRCMFGLVHTRTGKHVSEKKWWLYYLCWVPFSLEEDVHIFNSQISLKQLYQKLGTHSVDFHAVVPHEVTVLDAFEYTQLFCHHADCSVVIRLQLNFLHCHHFTSLIVNSCVHFTKSTLTCTKIHNKSHNILIPSQTDNTMINRLFL